jgi:hypothetical protein
MFRIRILAADDQRLRAHLLRGSNADEEAAFLLAAVSEHGDARDLLVRDVIAVQDTALLTKGRAGLEIDPVFISTVVKRARTESLAIALCHSHPFTDGGVRFSSIDDAGEAALFPRFLDRSRRCAMARSCSVSRAATPACGFPAATGAGPWTRSSSSATWWRSSRRPRRARCGRGSPSMRSWHGKSLPLARLAMRR